MNDSRDRAMTRHRIVEAATELFWRDGYHAVSTDAICKAAGVSKSSLYHAFPSKADVATEAMARVWGAEQIELRAICDAGGSPQDRFEAHISWHVVRQQGLRERFGVVMGTFDMALGVAVPANIRQTIRANQRTYDELLRRTVHEALGPRADDEFTDWITGLIRSAVSGAVSKARLRNDIEMVETLPAALTRLIAMARASLDAAEPIADLAAANRTGR
jgi:AcrR family transcriptional regulator